ncbi:MULTISPECIES: hypothetical protein [unclassified Curtobacterium]|uniref:hypothetical protein n=1 Tax=unclassified Curtobacterium TaxID=257496 RepID=UPI0008DCD43E|nr:MULTISPECIES: hypothetical protein [unclassified Curtobacterium]OIH94887.1 hypothetical protein BIU92_05815 [Curtobacterium sp. MCBA15_003]OII13009.1 hypothetical protein BIU97_03555 [Curtobacterium sp. MCBA15_009]OII32048.1 hypothetical protein BIU94_01360 [Curtobacterium sp. MMLR14_006]
MSTNLALVDPAVVPSRAPRPDRQHRPELVEVTPSKAQRRARPRIGYAVVAVAALGILLLAQLGISMVLSQGAYTLDSLSAERTDLSRTQQSLSEELRVLDSPQNLARNAQGLGMIANSTPVYLDPKTGRVYGTPTPAKPDESTVSTDNQVPNALLDDVPLAAKPGSTTSGTDKTAKADKTDKTTTTDTTDKTDEAATTEQPAQAAPSGKTSDASASDGGSSKSSVESDANQLQAPSTR